MQAGRRGPWMLVLAGALGLAGCGSKVKDCARVSDATERDWCYFDTMITYAEADRARDAINLVGYIESPPVRAAAIDRLFGLAPAGIDLDVATELCGSLPDDLRQGCLNKWNRPHLWTEQKKKEKPR